ncbi:hypothetical protein ACIO87_31475 [Streptomyces sp. NPDC087218]|uniref:hypothetical protein n=1 Tax=Streptomyces sp. NPDC087218 TaxID=3365769 RepID=UPI00380A8A61
MTTGPGGFVHPLGRPEFGDLLIHARPGGTVHITGMFRLVRGAGHILDVLDVLHRAPLGRRGYENRVSTPEIPT